jgi:hypothetical protein
MEENGIEKSKTLDIVSEAQIINVMEQLAVGIGAVNIKKTYNKDKQVLVWEIKVPTLGGGTKIYTYQRESNDGRGIVMVYFSNNSKDKNITRSEILAREVTSGNWTVNPDEVNIEKE